MTRAAATGACGTGATALALALFVQAAPAGEPPAGILPSLAADSALLHAPAPTPSGSIPGPVVEPETSSDAPFGPPAELRPPAPERPSIPARLPFGPGEWLKFSIDYGVINAGAATMSVEGVRRISGNPCFDIRSRAWSNAFFSRFYKVRDRSQSFLDVETLLPRRFEKRQREGSYRKDQLIKFYPEESYAQYENGEEIMVSRHAQDELSAFYYLRTLPLEVGRDVLIDNHSNRKNYPLRVKVHARESVEVGAGTFDCWVIEPEVHEDGIFQAKGTLTIWITADERRMPVRMRTKIKVGSVTASLTEYRLGEAWEGSQLAEDRF